MFGIGGGFGLVFAGLIIDNLSWRWLFIAGAVPVGVAVVLVHKLVPESPVRSESRIDLVGATLLSGTLVALLVALSEGETWGWTSARTLGLSAASIVLGAAFVVAELRVPEPLIDMKVFVERPVLLTNITALIAGFAMFGAFSLLPRFIEAPTGLPAGGGRAGALRLRRECDPRRPVPRAELCDDALRRAGGRAARPALRVEVAAQCGHAARFDGRRAARSLARPSLADRDRDGRARNRGSPSRSHRWPR